MDCSGPEIPSRRRLHHPAGGRAGRLRAALLQLLRVPGAGADAAGARRPPAAASGAGGGAPPVDPGLDGGSVVGSALAAGLVAAVGGGGREARPGPRRRRSRRARRGARSGPESEADGGIRGWASPALPPDAPSSTAPVEAPSRHAVLAQLARIVLPRYVPLAVRGGEAPPAGSFDAAAHYVAGRHREAAAALGALSKATPADPGIAFFWGVSELALGRPAAAREGRRGRLPRTSSPTPTRRISTSPRCTWPRTPSTRPWTCATPSITRPAPTARHVGGRARPAPPLAS